MTTGKPDAGQRETVRSKGRPSLAEADEINRSVRDAAVQVLLEHGEAATINAVANVAGLSRKSLYARYPNKNELFTDVIREMLLEVRPLEIAAADTFEQRIRNYIGAALRVIAEPRSRTFQRLITLNPVYIGALREELLGASRTLFFEPLLGIISRAKEDGEIEVGDTHATAQVLLKLIFPEPSIPENADDPWYFPRPGVDYADLIARIITRGLTRRA